MTDRRMDDDRFDNGRNADGDRLDQDRNGDDNRFDDEVMRMAAGLPRDIQPSRDLWPGIAADIQTPAETAFQWRSMLAQAAAVVLLIGGSSGLTWLAVKDDGTNATPVTVTNVAPLTAIPASFGDRYSLGPDFIDARRNLEGRLQQELLRLSPETRADVEASLRTIRGAIADINTALAAEPDNPLLQRLLLSSYREELAFMQQVNGITTTVMRRNDI